MLSTGFVIYAKANSYLNVTQMNTKFIETREEGLKRLRNFSPRAGKEYHSKRKLVLDTESRAHVSLLSPYLSHRLITESEVVRALFDDHRPDYVESFLQQLCWRTYCKGWLEGRPQVFENWKRLSLEDSRRWPEREEYQSAITGATGIAVFDFWVHELKSSGYLHNQARMCFASIWVFTLRLPWSLGASFFMDHLLDGDAASNTLNWRQVAGLQKKGQSFLVSADHIKRVTGGRFCSDGQLAEKASTVVGASVPSYRPPLNFPFHPSEQLGEDYAVLLTGDDLLPEEGALGTLKPKLILSLDPDDFHRVFSLSSNVLNFKKAALRDAVARAEKHFSCCSLVLRTRDDAAGSLQEIMGAKGLNSLVYFEPFVGPWKTLTSQLSSRDVGVRYFPLRRPWDGILHPHATKSYVFFKKHVLPQVVRARGSF